MSELDFTPSSEQDARVPVLPAASHPAGYVVVLLGVVGFVWVASRRRQGEHAPAVSA